MSNQLFNAALVSEVMRRHLEGEDIKSLSAAYQLAPSTIYRWKQKYAGMNEKQIQYLRRLEDENQRLQSHSTQLDREHRALTDALKKKL